MLTVKAVLKLSAIIDKLDIEIKDPNAPIEEVGKDLISQLARRAHKAENEILDFIMVAKKCTKDEAEEYDFIAIIKEYGAELRGFFKSAVK